MTDPVTDNQANESFEFSSAKKFDAWLAKNWDMPAGIWIKMAKKSSGVPSITSDEAVDVGLCWGWISSHRKPLDNIYYLQKYTPRRPKSNWSLVNIAKVKTLTAQGMMQPPGQAEVDSAKADGRWSQLAS